MKTLKGHNLSIKMSYKMYRYWWEKCDNIEDICNNFNNHFSSVAERIIKNSNLNASTEKLDNWVSSKLWLENTFSYIGILPEEELRDDHLTCRGGYVLFFFKYSDSQCCWKKYSDFGGGKKQ